MRLTRKKIAQAARFAGKRLAGQDGIALISALMFTMISLAIVTALMYIMTQSTKVSAANKRYKNALEASYGGADMFVHDMVPYLMQNYNNASLATLVSNTYAGAVIGQGSPGDVTCLQAKLTKSSSGWPSGCSNTSAPTDHPDLTFKVMSQNDKPYTIYSKIVETKPGNSDTSGLQLDGSGVAQASAVITPIHNPYIYRVEVQGQQSATSERAAIEVLYAY